MNALFAAVTMIDAGFKVIAADGGKTLVEFAEADAKALQEYYDKPEVALTPELAMKMTALAGAYYNAFARRAFIEVQCDNDTTARGLFLRVVPALVRAKAQYPAPEFANAVKWSVPPLDLNPLNIPQMAEHVNEVDDTCAVITELQQALSAAATAH